MNINPDQKKPSIPPDPTTANFDPIDNPFTAPSNHPDSHPSSPTPSSHSATGMPPSAPQVSSNLDPTSSTSSTPPTPHEPTPTSPNPSTSNQADLPLSNYDPIDHPFTPPTSPPQSQPQFAPAPNFNSGPPKKDYFPLISLIFVFAVPIAGIVLNIIGLRKNDSNKSKYIRNLILSVIIQVLATTASLLIAFNADKILINYVYKPDKIYGSWICTNEYNKTTSASFNRDQTYTLDGQSGTFSFVGSLYLPESDQFLKEMAKQFGQTFNDYEGFEINLSHSPTPYRLVATSPYRVLVITDTDPSGYRGYICTPNGSNSHAAINR